MRSATVASMRSAVAFHAVYQISTSPSAMTFTVSEILRNWRGCIPQFATSQSGPLGGEESPMGGGLARGLLLELNLRSSWNAPFVSIVRSAPRLSPIERPAPFLRQAGEPKKGQQLAGTVSCCPSGPVCCPRKLRESACMLRLGLASPVSTSPFSAVSGSIAILLTANHPDRAHRPDRGAGRARRHVLGFVRLCLVVLRS